MVIFPIDCFIFHVTKTDFLQVLRPEHMICSYCDPCLMDDQDSMHNRRVWGFILVPDQAILQHVYYRDKLYCFKRDSVLGPAKQRQTRWDKGQSTSYEPLQCIHRHTHVPRASQMAAPAHCNFWEHTARTFFNLNYMIVKAKGGGLGEENQAGV